MKNNEATEEKRKIIQELIESGFIISAEVLERLTKDVVIDIKKNGFNSTNLKTLGLNKEIIDDFDVIQDDVIREIEEIEKIQSSEEKFKTNNIYDEKKLSKYKLKVVSNYNKKPEKKTVEDFTGYFYSRFNKIQKLLQNNPKLDDVTGISRAIGKKNEVVSFIGMIYAKDETKKGNMLLTIEDTTGNIKILINKNNKLLYKKSKELVLDEIVGIRGKADGEIVYVDEIIFPDNNPSKKELKKYEKEVYGVFVSDIHLGANKTLEDKFEKFIDWINGNKGNEEHKRIVKKIKYLFITGDMVEGLGVYPGQESELLDKDISKQYEKVLNFLKKVPKEIAVIITPGNHDSVRLAEPQLSIDNSKYSKNIVELENVFLFSNPATVNVLSENNFSGFDILLYHGYSFDYYFSNVEKIRNAGAYDRGDLLLEFLLKKRHLAPTYESTLLMPEKEKDYLVIEELPDFFVTGHTHRAFVTNSNNITLISSGTFQELTDFQKKFGHTPDVGKIILTNFMTRENRLLKF